MQSDDHSDEQKNSDEKANFLFVVDGWLCVSRLRVEANLLRKKARHVQAAAEDGAASPGPEAT